MSFWAQAWCLSTVVAQYTRDAYAQQKQQVLCSSNLGLVASDPGIASACESMPRKQACGDASNKMRAAPFPVTCVESARKKSSAKGGRNLPTVKKEPGRSRRNQLVSSSMRKARGAATCPVCNQALVLGCICIVYMSMFFADALCEQLQGEIEKKNLFKVTKFQWLMQRKSMLSIFRFEERLLQQFEALASDGHLRVKRTTAVMPPHMESPAGARLAASLH